MTVPAERTSVTPTPWTGSRPKRAWLSRRGRNDLFTGLLFLAPSLILFGIFVYYSLGFNFYLSFTNWDFIRPTKTFIGLNNYRLMFDDPRFWNVFRNTTFYAIGTVSISALLGLILAVILNQRLVGRGLARTLIFSPYITTVAAISLLWIWIFDPQYGLVNAVLAGFGIEGPRWLTSTTWAMPAIIIMSVWRSMGYDMVLFLAGLQSIPQELYDAAKVDGANPWQSFWSITLPLLTPTTFFVLVTSVIGAFQVFDSIAVMTAGGPVDATKVFNFYIYESAFTQFRAGYAASVAVVLFGIIMLMTIFQLVLSRRWVHYQ
jgi:ABC-type sugar transport system permease subunit